VLSRNKINRKNWLSSNLGRSFEKTRKKGRAQARITLPFNIL
jgi:hypothetical protein